MRLVLVVAAILVHVGVADACQCDPRPSLAVSPPLESTVPAHPTFYVFAPRLDDSAATTFVDGFAVKNLGVEAPIETFRTKIVDIDPEYVVYAVTSDAREGTVELDVMYGGSKETGRYTIADAPVEDRARVIGLDHDPSYTSGDEEGERIWLESDGNAVALRFAWDDGTSTVIPPDSLFWSYPAQMVSLPHRTRLGMFCGHTNVALAQLAKNRGFGLYALFADGTSRRIGGAQIELSRDTLHMPIELVDARAPDLPRPIAVDRVDRKATIAIGGLVGLACWLATQLVARRRRHRPRYFTG